MRRLSFLSMLFLLVFGLVYQAHAAPAKKPAGEKKAPLVIMPLKSEGVDKRMLAAMETALVQGLQNRYKVYAGENVAKKAHEIFMRETRTAKQECDETKCMQDIAIAFQAELIAVASVTKLSDGFLVALRISNIVDDTVVFSNSIPCKGCDEYQVVDTLKLLAGGNSGAPSRAKATQSSPSAPSSPAVPSGDFSLDDLDNQAKAEEARKATEKAKWDKYLSEMKKAFGQVEGYERRDISKELKVSAWEKFLTSYKNDDPYSTEDKEMREKAKVKIERIKAGGKEIDGMVFVKGGCYEMGDTFGDGNKGEKPVHNVCVNDFYMGKYDVTVNDFREFVNSTGYRTEAETDGGCYVAKDGNLQKDSGLSWRTPGFSQTDRDPVVCVSWNDANRYIGWRGQKDGRSYRLPTEAEWEYAARSGGKREKFAGTSNESELGSYAWYDSNSGGKTHPVGQKRPNGLGLYDMSGNVWEWVNDWYGGNYYSNSPKDNTQGPSSGSDRVFRGGSWLFDARYARSARRGGNPPDFRYYDLGFRFVRTR